MKTIAKGIFFIIVLVSCVEKKESQVDYSMLVGTWKRDSLATIIGQDTFPNGFRLGGGLSSYDTLEYWYFLSFYVDYTVDKINSHSQYRKTFHLNIDGNKLELSYEMDDDFMITDELILNSLNDQTLVLNSISTLGLTSDGLSIIDRYFYKKVDSIEASPEFYENRMFEQYLARKARYDSITTHQPMPESAIPPRFSQGDQKFYELVSSKLIYPNLARRLEIEGKVEIGFNIGKDGQMTDFIVLKSPHEMLGKAAIDALIAVNKEALWIPASIDGRPINTFQIFPLTFKLN